jgi:putative ABC transport system permease protein
MFKNYIKIAWRNLWKSKTFSFVNIVGLAVGITGVLLIVFHIRHELSYDQGFEKADRIYRVTYENKGESNRHWAATPPPLGPALQANFPQIEAHVRLHRLFPYQLFSYTGPGGDVKRFEEKGGFFANADVITMFDLPFAKGDRDPGRPQQAAPPRDGRCKSLRISKPLQIRLPRFDAYHRPVSRQAIDGKCRVVGVL